MKRDSSLPALLIIACVFANSCLPAMAQEAANVETLTNQVLQKEIDLLRLTTEFRIQSTDRSRLKPWRLFLYNLAGSGVSNAGITTIAAERWRTWRKPATASRSALKTGPILLLIGHSIILSGLLTEAALDLVKDYKSRKKGLTAKRTKKRAIDLRDEIDALLEQRKVTLSANPTSSEYALVESQILEDLRDLAISDYSQSFVRSQKRIATRNVSYLNGASSAATGGYMGSLCGLLAVTEKNPRLAGPAGIGFILSGAQIAGAPILAKATADISGHFSKRSLRNELFATVLTSQNFDAHRTSFKALSLADIPNSLKNRIIIYDQLDLLIDEQLSNNAKETARADSDFRERLLFNAAIGGTKMGWGIQLANAGFSFQPPPSSSSTNSGSQLLGLSKQKGPNELFARRVAQGATTYIPGTGLWILDSLQARARGERELYTMGSQDALPHQKLSRKLAKLEDLERMLPTY